jgi:hypothetical protein
VLCTDPLLEGLETAGERLRALLGGLGAAEGLLGLFGGAGEQGARRLGLDLELGDAGIGARLRRRARRRPRMRREGLAAGGIEPRSRVGLLSSGLLSSGLVSSGLKGAKGATDAGRSGGAA